MSNDIIKNRTEMAVSMNFHEKVILGQTGLQAGRLGISSSFGAPAKAFEEAFDRGCNYLRSFGRRVKGKHRVVKTASIINRDHDILKTPLIHTQNHARESGHA